MGYSVRAKVKKIILIGIGGIILIIFLSWLWHYLHTGTIVITTNNKYDTIVLTEVTSKNSGTTNASPQTFKAHNKLSVNVSLGQYIASVQGNSVATNQLIKLSSHKTLRYNINPINATGVEPVTYQNAQDAVANSDGLLYLDNNTGNIEKVDTSNTLSTVSLQQFSKVKWANTLFGVGQDNNGHLYTINGSSINKLSVPFSYDGKNINFDVSSNKVIYVSHGGDVYKGTSDGNFKKIYSAKYGELALAAGLGQVAIDCEAEDTGDCAQATELAVVSYNGKINRVQSTAVTAGQLGAFTWSPNGKYLAVPGVYGVNIYDDSLHQISALPTLNKSLISNLQWLDDNRLFYSIADQLWIYSLSNQKAQIIANMPLADNITGISVGEDKSYVYLTTFGVTGYNTNNGYALRRIGLRGQKTPNFIYQLQDILPLNLADCTASLTNFAPQSPTILIEPFPDSNTSTTSYLQEVKTSLVQRGFNLSDMRFSVQQAD